MNKKAVITALLMLTLLAPGKAPAQEVGTSRTPGYYKDLFMDGGINLTSRKKLYAAEALGLSMEAYYSAPHGEKGSLSAKDTAEQAARLAGCEIDENSVLLYPDGAPRFRVIYVNGGHAKHHGLSLTKAGVEHIRTFVANGGGYVGTCAGAFIASQGSVHDEKPIPHYLQVYPGVVHNTWLTNAYTGMKVEAGSPLLKYSDFGGDMYIDSVRHNGGCFASTAKGDMPSGTEVLLRYDFDDSQRPGKQPVNGEIAAWAYKADKNTGRVVVIGSHPEIKAEGENLDLFKSMLLYALDGNAAPKVKGELKKGEIRFMKKKSGDHDPQFACIGDLQYHHFTVNIPNKARNIKVILRCKKEGIDMNLTMRKGDFAFAEQADYKDLAPGASKTLTFDSLPGGTWYIGVECATTVEAVPTDCGVEYTGHTEVLNGIPYSIQVTWD
ncbi:MAG: hypothetical protein J5495_06160 [Bacteroidales bacterium]|nr:hypothetical protein [Bacteroidales bacterium]